MMHLNKILTLFQMLDIRRRDKILGSVLAVLVGIIVAYAAIGFRHLIYGVQDLMLGSPAENILSYVDSLSAGRIIFSTVTGGLIISFIYRVLMKDNRAYSIADVMAANAVNHTLIPTKNGLLSAVTAAVALGTGSAAGREGPVVHLGATLSSWISQRLHLSPNMSRTILGCGVAAAVSASFNAPIAGVFFALEVILGHYALSAFAPIVIASVSATIVSRIHLGDFPAFIIPNYHITTFWEFPAFALLGVVSAVAAIIFIKCIFITEDFAKKIPVPEWLRPPIGGLAIGILALASPYILGHGYGTTDGALKELFSFKLLLILIVLKIAATSIALAFRYGSGIFSPSLFLGAMVGGAFGYAASIIAALVTGTSFSYGLYAIVGMGAVSSAVLGAPISTILIIFELTGDYEITIALMVSVVIANLITHHFLKSTSFFHMQLKQSGMDLEGGRARHVMRSTFVRSLMSDSYATATTEATIEQIHDMLLHQNHENVFIIDQSSHIVGSITVAELRKAYKRQDQSPHDQDKDEILHTIDFSRPVSVVLTPSDSLDIAFQKFDTSGEESLPVVSDDAHAEIIGVLYLKHVLQAYNKALLDEKE